MKIEWMEKHMVEAEKMITDNNVDQGLNLLNKLLYDEPGYSSLHNHLGWAYMYYTADSARAELHLNMAMKFEVGFAPPYLHMTALYVRLQRYDEAIALTEKALKLAGVNRVALLEQMGIAYELKKEYAKAIKVYKDAMVSSVSFEVNTMTEAIKRCRKKRLAVMFAF